VPVFFYTGTTSRHLREFQYLGAAWIIQLTVFRAAWT